VEQRLTRRLLTRAAATIVVAPSVVRALQREGFRGRTIVGFNGVDHAPRPGRLHPKRRLLFLSRVIPDKGAFDAVRAFAAVHSAYPESFLEVRGDGPIHEREKLKRLGDALGVGPGLSIGGPIPTDQEKWEIMSDSTAFVAPSYMEHYGLAVREALTVGLPTIVYFLPPFEDIEQHPSLVPVHQGDLDALSQAISNALAMGPRHRQTLIEAAQHSEVGPSWDEAVLREETILHEVVLGNDVSTLSG
jgi:glycosyltransferase involved in cell wall biosynthesis